MTLRKETEDGLDETKWFLYRAYTPEACNLLFARAWLLTRDNFLQLHGLDTRFDEDGKPYRLPVKWNSLDDLMNDSEVWGGLVFLRMYADKHGMKYKDFWQLSFKVLTDFGTLHNEIRNLMNSSFTRTCVLDEYLELKKQRIIMSDDYRLKALGFQALPFQIEYMEYLTAEVGRKYPRKKEEKLELLSKEGRLVRVYKQSELNVN